MRLTIDQIREAFNSWYMKDEAMIYINNYVKKRNVSNKKKLDNRKKDKL